MNSTKREIRLSNINGINKIMKYSILFIILTLLVIVLQIMFIYYAESKGIEMGLTETIASFGTFIFALIFILTQIFEILKCKRIRKNVNKNGSDDDMNFLYAFAKRNSVGNAVRFMQYVMLLITLVMAFYFGTYAIFDFSYNANINLYLPIIILLCVTTSFSVKYMECLTNI